MQEFRLPGLGSLPTFLRILTPSSWHRVPRAFRGSGGGSVSAVSGRRSLRLVRGRVRQEEEAPGASLDKGPRHTRACCVLTDTRTSTKSSLAVPWFLGAHVNNPQGPAVHTASHWRSEQGRPVGPPVSSTAGSAAQKAPPAPLHCQPRYLGQCAASPRGPLGSRPLTW